MSDGHLGICRVCKDDLPPPRKYGKCEPCKAVVKASTATESRSDPDGVPATRVEIYAAIVANGGRVFE